MPSRKPRLRTRASSAQHTRNLRHIAELEALLYDPLRRISRDLLELLQQDNENFPDSLRSLPPVYSVKDQHQALINRGEKLLKHLREAHTDGIDIVDERIYLRQFSSVLLDIRDLNSIISEEAARFARRSQIKNRHHVIAHAGAIILALQEALDFDPTRHHNNPPPALRIENPTYLNDVRALIEELRRLNTLLEAAHSKPAQTRRAAISLSANFQKFLDSYLPLLGKGAAVLTIASMAGLLYQLGLSEDVIGKVLMFLRSTR
jgi:hypothetical protein